MDWGTSPVPSVWGTLGYRWGLNPVLRLQESTRAMKFVIGYGVHIPPRRDGEFSAKSENGLEKFSGEV